MVNILDGRKIAGQIRAELKEKVAKLDKKPSLAVILVGDNPASAIYVREKMKAAVEIGAKFRLLKRKANTSQRALERIIQDLNRNASITGILVQKPLPPHIDDEEIDCLVDPAKDVDGLNPISPFIPSTALGVFELLSRYAIKVEGKKVVVVGRSKLVGLPTALEFVKRNATVTICHSKTANLAAETKQADILVVAAGKPRLIKRNMVKPGAVVIDVGINRDRETHKLVGDVDFENVKKVAGYVTPVPGGVGPMTVAALMSNLVQASSQK
ncbi:MAG: hypothetical protein A2126_04850 [Candidatus Woykebacteria bacterium GWB1_45_5]|uniref:Bifunctional protein FolD n=1 Tax=Candidatus Woykebacteria bacterium GWB1_45_5 TaxID=1802592 RepID=A0A1G1W563_9BACT|nr:MAG: hypothetical protein A2126_04850 [Candidatus Woykebacteria bacterium GWB1_45_5]